MFIYIWSFILNGLYLFISLINNVNKLCCGIEINIENCDISH